MFVPTLVAAALLLLAAPQAETAAIAAAPDPPAYRGVNLIIYYNDPQFQTQAAAMLDHLATLGINSVSIMLPFVQDRIDSSKVSVDAERSLSDTNLSMLIRAAKARGMSVFLRPVLDEHNLIEQNPQFWRGIIDPVNNSAWFDSYTRLLLPLAAIAQNEGVDMFSVGIELTSMESYTDNWLDLIAQIRAVYSGELVYSLNWDRLTQDPPPFLDALDKVGVDAFFPLTDVPEGTLDPSVPELVQAWTRWVDVTRAYVQKFRSPKSLIFTELGVRAQQGAFQRPYSWNAETATSGDSQARYYEAACQTIASLGLGGVYWWYTGLQPSADATDFDPLGKPAEHTLQQCFTQVLLG